MANASAHCPERLLDQYGQLLGLSRLWSVSNPGVPPPPAIPGRNDARGPLPVGPGSPCTDSPAGAGTGGLPAAGTGSSSGRSSPCTIDALTSAMLNQDLLGRGNSWRESVRDPSVGATTGDVVDGPAASGTARQDVARLAPNMPQAPSGEPGSPVSPVAGQGRLASPNRSVASAGGMSSIRRLYQYAANASTGSPGQSAPRCAPDGSPEAAKQFNNVEEMVDILQRLPHWASAVEAVSHSLYYLDNQAFAALLKMLGKVGLANRAFELFDWVTSRIDQHGDKQLSGLSDTYTYTTIISLSHGSRENCRRAMQYFAQMRQHNVPGNTFTYTALMSVCMKVNEAEAALDVYRGMLDAGLQPSSITHKIAMDAFCRCERWDDAVHVFTDMQSKGQHLEERTYTLVFMALGRTTTYPPPLQCPSIALRLYKQLQAQLPGRLPGPALHANLIKVFGRVGMWNVALHFFHEIPREHLSEPAVRDLADAFVAAVMPAEAQQALLLLPGCKQPRKVDTRGVCSSWNGTECFFQNLHGSCKYMHSHRPGRSNKIL